MYKVPEKVLVTGGLAALSLALIPMQADAFTINYYPITGDPRTELMLEADVLIEQLENDNQAKWTVTLLDTGSVSAGDNAGFKSFGFNFSERIAQQVSFKSLMPNWSMSGEGTQSTKLNRNGDMKFDYVYSADRRRFKSKVISFVTTFHGGGALKYTDFTEALYSSSADSALTGQVAGHVIGLSGGESGVAAGEVPTPALLPGLIGMGVAAIRKRKKGLEGEASEQ